jgi:hypothetical protein
MTLKTFWQKIGTEKPDNTKLLLLHTAQVAEYIPTQYLKDPYSRLCEEAFLVEDKHYF